MNISTLKIHDRSFNVFNDLLLILHQKSLQTGKKYYFMLRMRKLNQLRSLKCPLLVCTSI